MRRDAPWVPGTPCWIDVMTSDPAATEHFYGELFGWQVRPGPPGRYAVAELDGAAVAGVLPTEEHASVWNVYLAVADVDAACADVVTAGGEVVVPAAGAGDGRRAVCQEPSGAAFCLWQAGDEIGCEIVDEPGAFVWSELLTRDYDAAKQFHAQAFGVGLTEIGGDAFDFATIEVDGNTVGGIGRMPADFPHTVPPHWRIYFHAADVDACVAAATSLGAQVTIAPHDTPFGRWAGLRDPLGAPFCVITPPPPA